MKKMRIREADPAWGSSVVLYKDRFEVRLDGDTVWLQQEQIAKLFGKPHIL
jgi:predicted P-loop ATPase